MPDTYAIDHVILLARDLDRAAAWMADAHGLASVAGGRHEGHGTANRIVPLGDAYLEILGIADPVEAAASPLGEWARAGAAHPPALAALCVRGDAGRVAARLGLDPVPMSRRRPDGSVLSWRLVGYDLMRRDGLPFFIEWDGPAADHPGRAVAPHRVEPTGRLEVTLSGDPEAVGRHLGTHDLPIEIAAGPPGVARVVVETRSGAVVL